ncbi:hypothetical protein [Streptomyces sp. NPDC059816]|uniref:hypothetical protein n=1 Tax=Streptomyces sp. NPDC059816 TaxID=3346960 RepID=UPI003652DA9D
MAHTLMVYDGTTDATSAGPRTGGIPCPRCARRMDFTAHLEEGYERRTAADFGGGLGYVPTCAPCTRAVFLTRG